VCATRRPVRVVHGLSMLFCFLIFPYLPLSKDMWGEVHCPFSRTEIVTPRTRCCKPPTRLMPAGTCVLPYSSTRRQSTGTLPVNFSKSSTV